MQQDGAGRADLGRLPQDGVAGGEGLDDLHAVEEQRVVPGADDGDHAARPAVDGVALSPQPEPPQPAGYAPRSQQPAGLLLQETASVGEGKDVAAEGLLAALADVASHGRTEVVALGDQSRRRARTGRRRWRTDSRPTSAGPPRPPPRACRDRVRECLWCSCFLSKRGPGATHFDTAWHLTGPAHRGCCHPTRITSTAAVRGYSA